MQNTGDTLLGINLTFNWFSYLPTHHHIHSSTTFVIISITSISQTYAEGFKIEENLIDTI